MRCKTLIMILSFVLFFGCEKENEPVYENCISNTIIEKLVEEQGEVFLMNDSWYVKINSGPNPGRYFDCHFPDHLKHENSIIVFDAHVFSIPPNVRLAGTPITITKVY